MTKVNRMKNMEAITYISKPKYKNSLYIYWFHVNFLWYRTFKFIVVRLSYTHL